MGRGVALVHSYMRWSRWNEVGTPMDPDNFSHSFARLCEGAGLGHWHPHELRHSGASLMLAQGTPLHVVSEVRSRQHRRHLGRVRAPARR